MGVGRPPLNQCDQQRRPTGTVHVGLPADHHCLGLPAEISSESTFEPAAQLLRPPHRDSIDDDPVVHRLDPVNGRSGSVSSRHRLRPRDAVDASATDTGATDRAVAAGLLLGRQSAGTVGRQTAELGEKCDRRVAPSTALDRWWFLLRCRNRGQPLFVRRLVDIADGDGWQADASTVRRQIGEVPMRTPTRLILENCRD